MTDTSVLIINCESKTVKREGKKIGISSIKTKGRKRRNHVNHLVVVFFLVAFLGFFRTVLDSQQN